MSKSYGATAGRRPFGPCLPDSHGDAGCAASWRSVWSGSCCYGASGKLPHALERPGSSDKSLLRSGGLGPEPAPSEEPVNRGSRILELVLAPWLLLVFLLGCFLGGGAQGQEQLLCIIPVVILTLLAGFVWRHYKNGHNIEVILGLLCATSTLIASAIGGYASAVPLREYSRLGRGLSYINVLATEPAAGKSDATTMVFTNGTRVDTSQTYGFLDALVSDAPTYCVAPVWNPQDSEQSKRVEFWAAGINCCERRGAFKCGQAGVADARAGIVLPQWAQNDKGFRNAVSGAEAAYGLVSSDPYVLVRWVRNPIQYRDALWHSALTLFLIFATAYLVLSVMVGCALVPVLMPK